MKSPDIGSHQIMSYFPRGKLFHLTNKMLSLYIDVLSVLEADYMDAMLVSYGYQATQEIV